MKGEPTKLTPPEIARRWGISPEKVLVWVRSGELRALNVATRLGGRPRYVIDERDLADFELRRTVVSTPPPKRRRKTTSNVIEFF